MFVFSAAKFVVIVTAARVIVLLHGKVGTMLLW
jgi:hypothetical protein